MDVWSGTHTIFLSFKTSLFLSLVPAGVIAALPAFHRAITAMTRGAVTAAPKQTWVRDVASASRKMWQNVGTNLA